jgi:hypothetical protein
VKTADKVAAMVALARELAPGSVTSTQLLCSALMRDASANLLRCEIRLHEIRVKPAKKRGAMRERHSKGSK